MFKKQNKDKKEVSNLTFQDWLYIDKISKGIIYFKDNRTVMLLKVEPINFKLKSKLEQNAILNQYKLFLKNLKSKIQIIILSKKTDISYHLNKISKSTNENSNIKEMCDDYVHLLKNLVQNKGSITKEFYIALDVTTNIENEVQLIKEYLKNCGNDVSVCEEEEIIMVIRNYVSKRTCLLV